MKIKCPPWNGQPARYAHVKYDGHFVRVTRTRINSSHPTDLTDQLEPLNLVPHHIPRDTVLLGELHVPGKPASYVKTAIKNQDSNLTITYFAIEELCEATMSEPLAEWSLGGVAAWMAYYRLPFAEYIDIEHDQWTPEELIKSAVDNGYEGVVLKDGNLLNWRKLKPVQTIDLVVTGFEDGKGKYLGLTGALKCSVFTPEGYIEIASVSGMSDDERIEVSLDERSFLGKIVECRYQYLGAQGRLRHPAFIRWRDDKPVRDCGLDQDPALEEFYGR